LVVVREVVWTRKFERELRKVRDRALKDRVKEQIKKIVDNSDVGKPLRFALKGEHSIYIPPYRLIYSVRNETLYLLRFEHRKIVYR
jgi:mRNA-degrading endonuclease RelE of RelBE toxin-antitoxin system